MSATSLAIPPPRTGRSRTWKIALILIPVVTLVLLIWLRHTEVKVLRQRTISSYGTVPDFELMNQNGQPFAS
ncbi:MAG TPA: hypothetical protein VEI58_02655, partial [Chthoniobacterales bacterium]|nr:hypothetical protein [Chthoniobacterales bacterium]